MTERDSFYIQLFGRQGTELAQIAPSATVEEKEQAMKFIDSKWPTSTSIDFHAAFLEGLLRAKANKDSESFPSSVNIVVFISNSGPSYGESDRKRIVDNIYNYNYKSEGKPVKIYSLGFRGYADVGLLRAIAVTNDGVTVTLQDGPTYQDQIQNFFESEFGDVLLADVNVEYSSGGGITIAGTSPQSFSLLSDGYEVVVRGLLVDNKDTTLGENELLLQATTTAVTSDGDQQWQVSSVNQESSLCFQSYAHARIDQLMSLRDTSGLVSNKTLLEIANLVEPCPSNTTLSDCFKDEATKLALQAGIVAKGITGMVTIDKDECLKFEGETHICRDGTDPNAEMYLDRYDPTYTPDDTWPFDSTTGRYGMMAFRSIMSFGIGSMIVLAYIDLL